MVKYEWMKCTLYVFDILYNMLLSSVSPSFAPFLPPNVAQTLAEGSFDRYVPLNIHFVVFMAFDPNMVYII